MEKENKTPNPELMQVMSAMTARMALAYRLGSQYGGDRNLYTALGYPQAIEYSEYYARYKRQDIAKAVINRPIDMTWKGEFFVMNPDEENEKLKHAFETLYYDIKLKGSLIRLDKLACIGRYAVLLLGFDDVKTQQDWRMPVNGKSRKLLYIQPYAEDCAKINTYESDTANKRYGQPLLYDVQTKHPDGKTTNFIVHYTRVIHVTCETLEDNVLGVPVMQSIWNRLMDLEKLVGGSSEMYWRGARPGYSGKVDAEKYTMSAEQQEDFKQQIEEYEHNLRRFLINEGVEIQSLAQQIADPQNHVLVQIQMISSVTGIPMRILLGSERGELASSQDRDSWIEQIQLRRDEYANNQIIYPLVDRLMEYGVLPFYKKYTIEWPALFIANEKEKAEVGKTLSTSIKDYTQNPTAMEILPPPMFLKYIMGLTDEQIEEVELLQQDIMMQQDIDLEQEEGVETEITEE